MLKRRPDPIADAHIELCAELGLKPRDLSRAALFALTKLAQQREELRLQLAEAENLADRDMLTPTLNRRAFMRELHRSMSELERYGTKAAVIFIDLDGFKGVNDSYGHAAGDEILRAVARVLNDSVRESDVVARLGGDEFAVLLNRVDREDARTKAASLAAAINNAVIMFKGVSHRVRASMGLHYIAAPEEPECALARADEAMYAAKHAQRKG